MMHGPTNIKYLPYSFPNNGKESIAFRTENTYNDNNGDTE